MAILDMRLRPLALAELEAFDTSAPDRGRERRFCCPLPGCEGKTIDASHRSLSVNTETGLWRCARCEAGGKLVEFREERPWKDRRERQQEGIRQRFALPPPADRDAPPANDAWREELKGLKPLPGTVGERYLSGRGLSLELCRSAGVRFSTGWYGRPAVVFPIRDRSGGLVAAQGRHTDGRDDPKAHDAGPKSAGVFATPGAWQAETIVIVEAPINALSLAACGYPAMATLGCGVSVWLPRACAFRSVRIATDADQAGDKAWEKWEQALRPLGARPERLRPEGVKDWNDALRADPDGLRAFLKQRIPAPGWDEPEAEAKVAETCRRVAKWALADRTGGFDTAEAEVDAAFAAQDFGRLEAACAALLAKRGIARVPGDP